ncbi:MAG: sigma-70 family RNA polymerase sigma factor [Tannerellaceae bacterium]|jgi:RNA polymerase sigma-70 factor (ECF subfamily)|nr:sigma-70 family RNA polymerase sigma factor [Tannerellaceae bacterium]
MELERFKTTVLPLRNRLMNIALRLLGTKCDAEDVVQDAFLKLWHIRSKLNGYRSVEALAVTVTKNLALDALKKRNLITESAADRLQLDTADNHSPLIPEYRDEINCIKRIVEMLPPLQQSIVRMKDIEGYEVAEIAEITGTMPEAIRVNLSRARKKIKEQYMRLNRNNYEHR